MNEIICAKCGKVPFYTNFEIQKVFLPFDSDGNEIDLACDPVGLRSSMVKRCPYCERKVKIIEIQEEKDESID